MKPIVRSDERGFTLIELLVAIAILALVAVLAWRGLDQIVRGRDAIMESMADERVLALLFDQIATDARQAATDDEVGAAAISFSPGRLQLVRRATPPGAAPGLQVVRYLLADGHVTRYASPIATNMDQLKSSYYSGGTGDGWSAVGLMNGVAGLSARGWIPDRGWSSSMGAVNTAIATSANNVKLPQLGNVPLQRALTGLEVRLSTVHEKAPLTRIFMVGN
jgi:general secretion pathway protein J